MLFKLFQCKIKENREITKILQNIFHFQICSTEIPNFFSSQLWKHPSPHPTHTDCASVQPPRFVTSKVHEQYTLLWIITYSIMTCILYMHNLLYSSIMIYHWTVHIHLLQQHSTTFWVLKFYVPCDVSTTITALLWQKLIWIR